jgi:hypothetical protein
VPYFVIELFRFKCFLFRRKEINVIAKHYFAMMFSCMNEQKTVPQKNDVDLSPIRRRCQRYFFISSGWPMAIALAAGSPGGRRPRPDEPARKNESMNLTNWQCRR